MKPKKRHCIGYCNFSAYYGNQIGRGVKDIVSHRGRSFQRGYETENIQFFQGRPYQRGHGIGTASRRFGIPMLKFLGRHLLPAGVAVGSDIMIKRSLKETLRERGADVFRNAEREAFDRIASLIAHRGSGRVYKKRRRNNTKKTIGKRKMKTTKKRKKTTTGYFQWIIYITAPCLL